MLEQFFQQRAVLDPNGISVHCGRSHGLERGQLPEKGGPADPQTAGQILPGPGEPYHALLILLLQEMAMRRPRQYCIVSSSMRRSRNWSFRLHRAA